jgi:hypothetical protein
VARNLHVLNAALDWPVCSPALPNALSRLDRRIYPAAAVIFLIRHARTRTLGRELTGPIGSFAKSYRIVR